MKLTRRAYQNEDDFWRIRNFLREIFLLNGQMEHSTHVANFDHWRWHYILTCHETLLPEKNTTLWETERGQIGAVLHPICHDEIRMYVHPQFRTPELEVEMIAFAEPRHSDGYQGHKQILYVPVISGDSLRKEILVGRRYQHRRSELYWRRNLENPIPDVVVPSGYVIRSMGAEDELPARNWASWRAFHENEPDENFDDDPSWYRNIQSAPLYRRDLDIVAATREGEIAGFCTISYDDYTRSAVIVLDGTAADHRLKGLGEAMVIEGMQRLKGLGCKYMFVTTMNQAKGEFYRPLMGDHLVKELWTKVWTPEGRLKIKD
jgi:GNAT superfamily N-acetyltransferase